MANATKYVDNVNGNNANTGDSEVQAYADIATALANITGGGNIIYVQDAGSTYTSASTITWTAGLKGDTTNGKNRIVGYTTTPGANDGRPTINCSGSSVAVITLNDNDFWDFEHLEITSTGSPRGNGFSFVTSASNPVRIVDCVFDGCLSASATGGNNGNLTLIDSEVKNCTSTSTAVGGGTVIRVYNCNIHDNAGDGIRLTAGTTTTVSVQTTKIVDNGGIGVNVTTANSAITVEIHHCTIANNTGDGIDIPANSSTTSIDIDQNIIYGNAFGVDNNDEEITVEINSRIFDYNAYGGNVSDALDGISGGTHDVTLTVDPFTDSANGDYTLNNTAGGGASCRGAAFGGFDLGALQHEDGGVITNNYIINKIKKVR